MREPRASFGFLITVNAHPKQLHPQANEAAPRTALPRSESFTHAEGEKASTRPSMGGAARSVEQHGSSRVGKVAQSAIRQLARRRHWCLYAYMTSRSCGVEGTSETAWQAAKTALNRRMCQPCGGGGGGHATLHGPRAPRLLETFRSARPRGGVVVYPGAAAPNPLRRGLSRPSLCDNMSKFTRTTQTDRCV